MRAPSLAFLAVILVALAASLRGIQHETYSSDEGMWILQGQKMWPLFRDGEWDRPEWDDLDNTWGSVNPPVAKYILGSALQIQDARWAWDGGKPPPPHVLIAGRRASAVAGALGCLALLAIGWRTIGAQAALVAALLLAASPLWIFVSRHAMTDVYAATFALLSVAALLSALEELRGKRRWPMLAWWALASGALSGLAVGSKLNAASTPVALGVVLGIAFLRECFAPRQDRARRAGAALVMGALFAGAATCMFVGTNPFLHDDPWGRFQWMIDWWRNYVEAQARSAAAGGFGAAFFPRERGHIVLLAKTAFPVRTISLLLLVPFAMALLARFAVRSTERARAARLIAWLLLLAALCVIGASRNQILHSWIVWVGSLAGMFAALFGAPRDAPGAPRSREAWVILVWGAVVTYFVWSMTFLPVSRYYLPILPIACLFAGQGFVLLAEDVRSSTRIPGILLGVALLAGGMSVVTAFPDSSGAVALELFRGSKGALSRALHWISAVGLAASIVSALRLTSRRAEPTFPR